MVRQHSAGTSGPEVHSDLKYSAYIPTRFLHWKPTSATALAPKSTSGTSDSWRKPLDPVGAAQSSDGGPTGLLSWWVLQYAEVSQVRKPRKPYAWSAAVNITHEHLYWSYEPVLRGLTAVLTGGAATRHGWDGAINVDVAIINVNNCEGMSYIHGQLQCLCQVTSLTV